jgi:hypothetical protein
MKSQYLPFNDVIVSHCELCGKPLNADEVYGPEDMDLCRFHHGKFMQMMWFFESGEIVPVETLENLKEPIIKQDEFLC